MIVSLLSAAPKSAGIYALCAGHGRHRYIAYVGVTKNIRQRLLQHLVRKDSSIVTGASAVSLDPDRVTEVRWWLHPLFEQYMAEAEVVAFRILDPVLRSRQKVSAPVEFIADREDFARQVEAVFSKPPSGSVEIPTYQELLHRVAELEKAVRMLHSGRKSEA